MDGRYTKAEGFLVMESHFFTLFMFAILYLVCDRSQIVSYNVFCLEVCLMNDVFLTHTMEW